MATKTPAKKGKRKAPKHLPEPRGRRGHKAVDEQPGLREWLIEQLQQVPRPTLAELMDLVKGTGYSIGRTAVWEFRVAWEKLLAERDLALRQAAEYAALGDDQPLKLEAAIATMSGVAILTDLRAKLEETGGTVNEDIRDLMNLASRMQMSASLRERTKNHIERSVMRAIKRMTDEIEEKLKADPAALKTVLAAMRDAAKQEAAK